MIKVRKNQSNAESKKPSNVRFEGFFDNISRRKDVDYIPIISLNATELRVEISNSMPLVSTTFIPPL